MAFKPPVQEVKQRLLGNHEIQIRNCHKKTSGAMNISTGLTLVTRHQIDEGKPFSSNVVVVVVVVVVQYFLN